MDIRQILVFKESRAGEGRVALTPEGVNQLAGKDLPIFIERSAGALAQFSDQDYADAGAKLFTLDAPLPSQSFILRVKRPTQEREAIESPLISEKSAMMGFLDPLDHELSHVGRWKSLGLKLISLELLPLMADDPRNAQAAMSHIAGRLALRDAVKRYQGSQPKKVTVIGTGPAGLAAAQEARQLQLPVQLFGRREKFRALAEAEGIQYFVLPEENPRNFLRQHLADQTIVITAARVVGAKAPLLIDEPELKALPEAAIVVDLSTGEGSSVKGSKSDEIITVDRHISIINISGYPKAEPRLASKAFSDCMVNLVLDIITPGKQIDFSHHLLKDLKC